MISPRYLTILCALVALPLVPTIIHSYAGTVTVDSLTTRSIPTSLLGYTSEPTRHDAEWARSRFDSTDWMERRYDAPGDELILTAIRSFDLKKLYHHPELDVAYGVPFLVYEVRRFPERPDVPVHILSTLDRTTTAMYVLHYDGGFVEDPVTFQLKTAAGLLFSGRRPMTLLFVRDVSSSARTDAASNPARKLLFSAIDGFTGPA